MPLINCEKELDLTWSKYCVISEISRTLEVGGSNLADSTLTTGATFQINNGKLYAPFVTLTITDNIKLLKNIKQGFKRTISWNKYRSETTTQTENIDTTFRNINRLFELSFKNGDDHPTRNSFDEYCMSLVEIKNFNALNDSKPFFDQPVKNKQEAYEKLIEMSRNNDYTTGNILDYLYHQKYYKLIGIIL